MRQDDGGGSEYPGERSPNPDLQLRRGLNTHSVRTLPIFLEVRMRQFVVAACGLGILLAVSGPARAQDDECRSVVARAMKAVGGEDKLAAYKAAHVKGKGTVSVMGMDLEFN